MYLRLSHQHGDRRPVGYVTDEPEFTYELAADTPRREDVATLVEESATWTAPRYGGAADPDDSCGGYARVPATDRDRILLLERRIPDVAPLVAKRVEGEPSSGSFE